MIGTRDGANRTWLLSMPWILVGVGMVVWSQAAAIQDLLGLSVTMGGTARQSTVAIHRWSALWQDQWNSTGQGGALPWLRWLTTVAAMLAWLLSLLGWGGIGAGSINALTHKSGPVPDSQPAWSVMEVLLVGWVLLGLAIFLVGSLGFPGSAPLCLGALLIMGWFGLLRLRSIGLQMDGWRRPKLAPSEALAWGGVALCGFLVLVAGMVPPIQSDAMRYHLAAPQQWLASGRIVPLELNAFSAFPFLPGMHFLLSCQFGVSPSSLSQAPLSGQLAAWMHAFAWFGIMLTGVDLINLLVSRSRRHLSTLVWLLVSATLPSGMILASWPFIDHYVTLFVLMIGRSLVRQFRPDSAPNRPAEAWRLGIWLGALLSTKYTALPMLSGLAVACIASGITASAPGRAQLLQVIRGALPKTLLAMVIIGGPWYLRNLLHYGNPLYPALAPRIGSGDWSADSAKLYAAKLAEKGDHGWLGWLTALGNSSWDWPRFEAHYLGGHGLVLLVAAALGLGMGLRHLTRGRSLLPHRTILPFWAMTMYAAWAATYQSNRMLVPVLLLLAPVSISVMVHALGAAQGWLRTIAAITLLAVAFQGGAWAIQWMYLAQPHPPLPTVLGRLSPGAYLGRALNYYSTYAWLASGPPERARWKVIHHGEHRIFYARHQAVWSDWFDTPPLLAILREDQCATVTDLLRSLRQRGITHILINDSELAPQMETYFRPRFRESEWTITQELLGLGVTVRGTPGGVRVLEIKGASQP